MITPTVQYVDCINPYRSSTAIYGRNSVTVEPLGKVDGPNTLVIRQLPEGDIFVFERRDALFGDVSLAVIGILVPAGYFFQISGVSQAPDPSDVDLEISGRFFCGEVTDQVDQGPLR